MGSLGLRVVFALALILIMAAPVFGQEGEPTCEEAAAQEGGGAHLQLSEQGGAFMVEGCNFQAGEQATVEARLKLGDADFTQLDPMQATAGAQGDFEVSFQGEGTIDYSAGYHFEAAATGSAGSEATAGVAGIASGGPMMPETGGGGTAGTTFPLAPALVVAVIAMLSALAGRRLATC